MTSNSHDLTCSAGVPPQAENSKHAKGRKRVGSPVVSRSVVDRLAFEQLHQRLHKSVWRKVSYLIQNEEEAKDIVQETFLKLWYKGPPIGPESNVDDWIYHVALNKAKDYLKSARGRRNTSLDPDILAQVDNMAVEGMEERVGEALLCWQVLGQLKEMERTCLVLSSIWKLKQSEIAAYIEEVSGRKVTVRQVEHAIYHAKETFRRLYPDL
jgi:RNA polymerase sigma-70 factor (ECF subfamily)